MVELDQSVAVTAETWLRLRHRSTKGFHLGAVGLLIVRAAAAEAPASPDAEPSNDTSTVEARVVRTQPSADTCVSAHERGVDFADAGRLLDARNKFSVCVSGTCPAVIRDECASELSKLRSRIPSVVFVAKNEAGRDITDVTVKLDGKLLANSLTSRAIPLEPGPYEFHFTSREGATATRVILLREGEQQRRVRVEFPGSAPMPAPLEAPPVQRSSPWTPPVVISTVVGTLGLVSFGYFALAGTSLEGCAPHCTAEEVSALRLDYAMADLSLLVGLAGITTAVILYESPSDDVSAHVSPRRNGITLQTAWRF